MRQQINLYQSTERESSAPLASRMIGLGAGAVVACLLTIWGFGMHQVSRLEIAVEAVRTQQLAQEQTFSASGGVRPPNLDPAKLQAEVKSLSAQVTARKQALAILRSGGAGQKGGFAARLEALARRHTHGLWIDRIVLSGTTGAMSVGGATLNPDLVPRYLRALAGESALTGTRFDELTIERHSKPVETEDTDGPAKVEKSSAHKAIRFRAESISLRAPNPEKPS